MKGTMTASDLFSGKCTDKLKLVGDTTDGTCFIYCTDKPSWCLKLLLVQTLFPLLPFPPTFSTCLTETGRKLSDQNHPIPVVLRDYRSVSGKYFL